MSSEQSVEQDYADFLDRVDEWQEDFERCERLRHEREDAWVGYTYDDTYPQKQKDIANRQKTEREAREEWDLKKETRKKAFHRLSIDTYYKQLEIMWLISELEYARKNKHKIENSIISAEAMQKWQSNEKAMQAAVDSYRIDSYAMWKHDPNRRSKCELDRDVELYIKNRLMPSFNPQPMTNDDYYAKTRKYYADKRELEACNIRRDEFDKLMTIEYPCPKLSTYDSQFYRSKETPLDEELREIRESSILKKFEPISPHHSTEAEAYHVYNVRVETDWCIRETIRMYSKLTNAEIVEWQNKKITRTKEIDDTWEYNKERYKNSPEFMYNACDNVINNYVLPKYRLFKFDARCAKFKKFNALMDLMNPNAGDCNTLDYSDRSMDAYIKSYTSYGSRYIYFDESKALNEFMKRVI